MAASNNHGDGTGGAPPPGEHDAPDEAESMDSTADDTGARRRKRWQLLAHHQTSATQRLARAERATRVRSAMEHLPDAQREAITLWLSGYTAREIAARMQVTELAVAGLIRRGLVALRERLAVSSNRGART